MSGKISLKNFFGRIKNKKFIVIIAGIVVITVIVGLRIGRGKNKTESVEVQTTPVTYGDVEKTISGSGTVEPNERYEIIPLVNGEIISCPYEVGDYVEEGAVVYSFDKTDAELNLRKQQNSMQSSTNTYNKTKSESKKLTVTAPASGVVKDITLKKGDDVTANCQVATIYNDRVMEVDIPFNQAQINQMSKGDTAIVTSSALMSTIEGTVTHIENSSTSLVGGAPVYNVTISFNNPGGVEKGAELGGCVNGQISSGYGIARYSYEGTITTEIAGTVSSINIKNGDFVNAGQTVMKLSSTDLESALKNNELTYENAQINLEEQMNALDDYSITSPISGTVITKNSKAGDTIDKTNSSVSMMVIADISKLKFTLEIDELDISEVEIGQEVKITSDAVEGATFIGYITEMSMEGVSSNGVTTYSAIVTIDDPGELKPSMNVDAVVVTSSAKNVLRVSSNDIISSRGKSYVYIKDDGATKDRDKKNDFPGENAMKEMPVDGMRQGEIPEEGNSNNVRKTVAPEAPDGFKTVEIQIGIEGDDFTEVISGLSAGDLVYVQEVSQSSNNSMISFGGMGGGMPGGGMNGGMPGGGMSDSGMARGSR